MLSRGARRTRAVTFIMVPRRGCLLCLRVLAALLGAAAEQQVNVLAQTSVQVPDQGTQSSRREADHSEVNTLTHGLSELQTTLDPSVVATPCPALTPTLHLGALPSPDPSKAPWVDRFEPRPTCDPEHARGTRCDSGVASSMCRVCGVVAFVRVLGAGRPRGPCPPWRSFICDSM